MTQITLSATAAADTGSIITKDTYDRMVSLYREKFPNSKQTITIDRAAIREIIQQRHAISGIRFMLALDEQDDLKLILMPCNKISFNNRIPNCLILPEGYRDSRNQLQGLSTSFKQMARYASERLKEEPQIAWNKLVRGIFFGINSLAVFFDKMASASLRFHLAVGLEYPYRNMTTCVLELTNDAGSIYMDTGSPCPPDPSCEGGPDTCLLSMAAARTLGKEEAANLLNRFRIFRNEIMLERRPDLVDMYYYGIPGITEAVEKAGNRQDLYNSIGERMQLFDNLIRSGEYDRVIELYQQEMEMLFKKHLFQ
jgi:hypothetical protein